MPPRVAHLVCPAVIGGAETVVRLLSTARRRRGLDTQVIAITDQGAGHPFVSELCALDVPVTIRRPMGRRYLAEVDGIAEVVRDLGIEVLHTHVYRADFIGYFAARKTGAAAVSTFHGETGGGWLNRFYEWSVKRLFKRFDAVVCVSRTNQEKLRAAGSNLTNSHLVRNGAGFEDLLDRDAARQALRLARADTAIGWIGRLSEEKGPDLMLRAFESIDDAELRLIFIGDGSMRDELEARAAPMGTRVRFAGAIPSASRLLRAFDVVAMSSRMEGMPMVMLEAMAARVPVVGFLVGGIPEVLSDQTGWPVPADDVAGLAGALAMALREGAVAAERSAAAQALVRRDYGVDSWVDAMEAVYAAALTRK